LTRHRRAVDPKNCAVLPTAAVAHYSDELWKFDLGFHRIPVLLGTEAQSFGFELLQTEPRVLTSNTWDLTDHDRAAKTE